MVGHRQQTFRTMQKVIEHPADSRQKVPSDTELVSTLNTFLPR